MYRSPKDLMERIEKVSDENAVNGVSTLEVISSLRTEILANANVEGSQYAKALAVLAEARGNVQQIELALLQDNATYVGIIRGFLRKVINAENPGTDYVGDAEKTTAFDFLEGLGYFGKLPNDLSTAARVSSYVSAVAKDYNATTKVKRVKKPMISAELANAALAALAEKDGKSVEGLVIELTK